MRKGKVLYWIWVLCWGKMLGVWWSMHWLNNQVFRPKNKAINDWRFASLGKVHSQVKSVLAVIAPKWNTFPEWRRNMSRVVNTTGLGETKLTVFLSGPLNLIGRSSCIFTSCKARVKFINSNLVCSKSTSRPVWCPCWLCMIILDICMDCYWLLSEIIFYNNWQNNKNGNNW